ncbi:MAG: hypothetical protein ACOY94_26960 [Bacillota bacterium]
MSPRFLLQSAVLLFLGQFLLGGIGRMLTAAAPWAGLPVTLFLIWFILRTAAVFREEMAKAIKGGAAIQPLRLALFVALAAQVPGLVLLPYWAPALDWFYLLWQGAAIPVAATVSWLWPVNADPFREWLWLAAFLQMALFVWGARTPERPEPVSAPTPARPAAGEWAPARRVAEVQRRGRRVR